MKIRAACVAGVTKEFRISVVFGFARGTGVGVLIVEANNFSTSPSEPGLMEKHVGGNCIDINTHKHIMPRPFLII